MKLKDKKFWLHYLILTALLFVGFYIGENLFEVSRFGYFRMFVFWFAVLIIADQITHKILGIK
jgi:hypothetical protein